MSLKSIKPKKKFGQNFLIDDNIARDIVSFLSDSKTKTIIEIGPGKGILTKHLLKIPNKEKKFVEIDKECIEYLNNTYSNLKKDLINGDFLQVDLKSFKNPISIIGNFPYNISSQILFKSIDNHKSISGLIGMFQKEVAERIISKNNCKQYGILSVKTQLFYDTKILFNVSPNVFFPKPKIDSSVISLTRKKNLNIGCDLGLLDKVIKLSFQQRRKKIKNSLKRLDIQENILEDSIFELRPEQLTIEEFVKLTKKISDETI